MDLLEDKQMNRLDLLRRQNQTLLEQLQAQQLQLTGSFYASSMVPGQQEQTQLSHASNMPTHSSLGKHSFLGKHKLLSSQQVAKPHVVFYKNHFSSGKTIGDSTNFAPHSYQVAGEKVDVPKRNRQVLAGGIDSSQFECELPETDLEPSSILKTTPVKSCRDTPKSILKHRKIIDDNVTVASQFEHTPTTQPTPGKKQHLNFSYSGSEDQNGHVEDDIPSYMRESELDGSYLEEVMNSATKKQNSDKKNKEQINYLEKEAEQLKEVENLYQQKLLLDSGNDRKHAKIVMDLSSRPKTVVFDTETAPLSKSDISATSKPTQQNSTCSPTKADLEGSRLLGYDWIAGLLDSEGQMADKPEDFYRDIETFRRRNKGECVSTGRLSNILDLSRPISPEMDDPRHMCIHGYTVNDRLFPSPMNKDENGQSICPICLIPRHEPKAESPGFVRVSIPRSTLETPYRVKPHRRNSFDSSDSYALSKHCLSGWECSRPAAIPTAKNLDLKETVNGIQEKCSMTLPDAMMESYRSAKNVSHLGIATARSNLTEELLNTSCALRFGLQKLERDRGLNNAIPANSTAYPLF